MGDIVKFSIENTGAAQAGVPFTFGQVFKEGAVKMGQALEGRMATGGAIQLQADYKATHPDGSARHAVISGILPALVEKETSEIMIVPSTTKAASAVKATFTHTGFVELTIGGAKYSASIKTTPAVPPLQWLSGPIAQEWITDLPLIGADGKPHPLLTLRAGLRWYASGQARVEVIIENTKTWAAASSFTYDVSVVLNGAVALRQTGIKHYHHARWSETFWLGQQPAIDVKIDARYLMVTKAVSNYAAITIPPDRELVNMDKMITASNTGPMTIGPLNPYMGTAGGRGDIGPLPTWSVMWLLSMDRRARKAMMAAADGSGSWSIHYRDEKTGYPVRTDNDANKNITMHYNMREQGPLPVPRFVGNDGSLGDTPFSEDTAHQPSLAYLPYLVTGEYYYLEELQFWASSNPLGTAAGNHGNGKGLVRWQQLRGQAWSLRTLGHAAYITPDDHPLKGYFVKQVDNNLDFYHQTYVVGNPNKLGVYDGSGESAFQVSASAPWQDDFFTWSFGYLAELGFEKAKPILQWKAKYSVGRMTAPGYCWIQGAAYGLQFRDSPTTPIYDSFEKLYKANFSGDEYLNDNGKAYKDPSGVKYIDLPCGSEEQRAFLERAHGHQWLKGRMTGYSDSSIGYPSNMQPALAVAADAGIENAGKAWALISTRGAPPFYPDAPQWNIVPRTQVSIVAPVETPPVAPVTPPVVPVTPATPPANDGTWEKIGVEGQKLTVPAGTLVRYGVAGVAFVEKTVSGDFTATNDFFGKDPVVGTAKTVEKKKASYSIQEKVLYILVGPDGTEIAHFGDKKMAQQVLAKF